MLIEGRISGSGRQAKALIWAASGRYLLLEVSSPY
jgi:hypothetical protein